MGEVEAMTALKMKTKFVPAMRAAWLEEVIMIGQQLLVRIPFKDHNTGDIMEKVIEAATLMKYEVEPVLNASGGYETLRRGAMKQKVVKREIIDVSGTPASPEPSSRVRGTSSGFALGSEIPLAPLFGDAGVKAEGEQETGQKPDQESTSSSSEAPPPTPTLNAAGLVAGTKVTELQAQMANLMTMVNKLVSGEIRTSEKDHFTLKEREAWVFDAEINAIEAKLIRRYRVKSSGELEHPMIHQMRLVYWKVLMASLGDYLYLADEIYVGDVRQLWCAVSAVAQENSAVSLHSIEAAIREHVKTQEMTYPVWIKGLDAQYMKMQMLRAPKADRQKVMDVIFLLIDKRYKSVKTSITHDSKIGYEAVKIKLKAKALECSDIEPKNSRRSTSAVNATERRDSGKGGNNRGGRGQRGGRGKDGRGGGRGRGRGAAQGGTSGASDEPCLYHLVGTCIYGDKCFKKHITMAEAKVTLKEGQKPRSRKRKEKRAEDNEDADEEAPKDRGICYQWRDHEACERGDECRFTHNSNAMSSSHFREESCLCHPAPEREERSVSTALSVPIVDKVEEEIKEEQKSQRSINPQLVAVYGQKLFAKTVSESNSATARASDKRSIEASRKLARTKAASVAQDKKKATPDQGAKGDGNEHANANGVEPKISVMNYKNVKVSKALASVVHTPLFLPFSPDDLVVLENFGGGKSGGSTPLESKKARIIKALGEETTEDNTRYRVELIHPISDKGATKACATIGIAHKNVRLVKHAELERVEGRIIVNASCTIHGARRLRITVDTGAEDTLNPYEELFEPGTVQKVDEPIRIVAFNGSVQDTVTHQGTLVMQLDGGEVMRLTNVYFAPKSERLLISTREIGHKGYTVETGGGKMVIRKKGVVVMKESYSTTLPTMKDSRFKRHNKVPAKAEYDGNNSACHIATRGAATTSAELMELHDALGHPGFEVLAALVGWEKGIVIPKDVVAQCWCASCMLANSKDISSIQQSIWWTNKDVMLTHVSADLIILSRTLNGFVAFLLIVEWASRMKFGAMIKAKSEAGPLLLAWCRWAQAEQKTTIRNIHIDGGEMDSNLVLNFVNNQETAGALHTNKAGAHNHNSIAERHIQQVENLAGATMQRGGADAILSEYAYPYAVETANLLPRISELRKARKTPKGLARERPLSPLEIWKGQRMPLDTLMQKHLPLFGEVVVHIIREDRKSHDLPGFRGMNLGFASPRVGPGKQTRALLVKRYSDGKVVTARVAKATGVYPMKLHLTTLSRGDVYKWMHEWRNHSLRPTFELPQGHEGPLELDGDSAHRAREPDAEAPVIIDADTDEIVPALEQQVQDTVSTTPAQPSDSSNQAIVSLDTEEVEVIEQQVSDIDEQHSATEPVPDELTWGSRHAEVPAMRTEQSERTQTRGMKARERARLGIPSEEEEKNDEHYERQTASEARELAREARVEFSRQKADEERSRFTSKFPIGTRIMSLFGPGTVQTMPDKQNDIEVNLEDGAARYTIPAKDGEGGGMWLPEEYPNDVYDTAGRKLDMQPMTESNLALKSGEERSWYNELVCDAYTHAWHKGYRDSTYSYEEGLKLCNVNLTSVLVPERLPGFTMDALVGKVKASVVNEHIPKFWHLQRKIALYPLIAHGEDKEVQELLYLGCFGEPRDIEPGEKAIGLMWVTNAKPGDNGWFKSMKLRLTLLGNQEKHLMERVKAYAPVSMQVAVRMIIAMHINEIEHLRIRKRDITQAYLNTVMKRKVVVKHPPGMEIYVDENGALVYRRLKPWEKAPTTVLPLLLALYGGMECGRLFWDDFVAYHLVLGFRTVPHERCCLHIERASEWITFCFHVDDSVHVNRGDALWDWYTEELTKRYKFTDEELTEHLGTRYVIDRVNRTVKMDQQLAIEKMLRQHGMTDCKAADVPAYGGKLPSAEDVPEDDKERETVMKSFEMDAALGSLVWVEQTKPAIMYVVRILSKAIRRYGQLHITWCKHLMRWCKGTASQPLTYRAGFALILQIFTDASHAGCADTRRSIAGVIIKYGGNTLWCKAMWLQIVAHSSFESELMAEFRGMTMGQYVCQLQDELGGPSQRPVPLFIDNQAAKDFSSNPIQSGRNLHMHARFFSCRDLVSDEMFVIMKLASKWMVSDVLVSWKGKPNFKLLHPLIIDCAMVIQQMIEGKMVSVWDTSLIA
jgi:hypothetical protein